MKQVIQKIVILAALGFFSSFAQALDLIGARVVNNGRYLVITVLKNDCNHLFGLLTYQGSNRRYDGPHRYDLRLGKTLMRCPSTEPKMSQVRIEIPTDLREGDTMVIRYRSGNEVKTMNFRVRRFGRVPSLPLDIVTTRRSGQPESPSPAAPLATQPPGNPYDSQEEVEAIQ